LIGARQRRRRLALVEAHHRDRLMREIGGEQLELRRHVGPIVERRLQRRRDMSRLRAPGEIVADDDETPVAAALQ
jgi:hypothetical protein